MNAKACARTNTQTTTETEMDGHTYRQKCMHGHIQTDKQGHRQTEEETESHSHWTEGQNEKRKDTRW